MARDASDMVDTAAAAAVAAVTAMEDEEDAVLMVDLVVALTATTAPHTKGISEVLTAPAVPTITADQDDVVPGVGADRLEDLILSSVPSVAHLVSSRPQPYLHRCGRRSLASTRPTLTSTLQRRTTKTLPLKPTSSTHLPHT